MPLSAVPHVPMVPLSFEHELGEALREPEVVYIADASNQRLATLLRDVEESYYRRFAPPDQAIILRVDPELAVRRKTAEPADYVRRRARVIWETDWAQTGAHVVDAGRPLPEVLAELKAVIWSGL
ncbi:MAG: hypothetical protein ACREL9_04130 [Gemmatimonadales bacterium]